MDLQRARWRLKLQKMRFEVWRARHRTLSRIGSFLARVLRFGFTVFCASLVTAWWQPELQRINHGIAGFWDTSVQLTAAVYEALYEESESLVALASFGNWSLFEPFVGPKPNRPQVYQAHLEKTLSRLRRIQYYRMVRVDLPANILRYQAGKHRLEGKSQTLSFLAVSKDLKTYLLEKDITFIEVNRIPERLVAGMNVPLKRDIFRQTLLIPDVTGDRAQSFRVAPKR